MQLERILVEPCGFFIKLCLRNRKYVGANFINNIKTKEKRNSIEWNRLPIGY